MPEGSRDSVQHHAIRHQFSQPDPNREAMEDQPEDDDMESENILDDSDHEPEIVDKSLSKYTYNLTIYFQDF